MEWRMRIAGNKAPKIRLSCFRDIFDSFFLGRTMPSALSELAGQGPFLLDLLAGNSRFDLLWTGSGASQ